MDTFQAGQIKERINEWMNITTDRKILSMVQGTRIEIEDGIELEGSRNDKKIPFSKAETEAINSEINDLLQKGVIEETCHEHGEFISNIFTREKKDGSFRVILNLKRLNQHISYQKFKMETLQSALTLVSPGCYMGSIDLISAYYSVPIAKDHQKYLKFEWDGKLFKFKCYPNGLAQAPRNFTKITRPIYAYLHGLGHITSCYLDDSLLIGNNKEDCENAVKDTIDIFDRLGFVVHPHKSVLVPSQKIIYLGFELDSVDMTISLSEQKTEKVKTACTTFLQRNTHTIREAAKIIGLLISCIPAYPTGQLHYRTLEREKVKAIKRERGNWEGPMAFSCKAKEEIKWWKLNATTTFSPISRPPADLVITSDASLRGWGAACQGETTGGAWAAGEGKKHINELELLAAFLAIKSFCKEKRKVHVKIFLDNTTAMHCINKMGSSKSISLDQLSRELWQWCLRKELWLSAGRIAGKDNVEADRESRIINIDAEWMLNKDLLQCALAFLQFEPNIDLFASRLNYQFPNYVSYRIDPGAMALDAFSLNWTYYELYAFPPFSLISRVIRKIREERASGVLVAPYWPTQPFFPLLMRILIAPPVLLSSRTTLLSQASEPDKRHPLHKKLRLMICRVCGKNSETKAFLTKQPIYSWHLGEGKRNERITALSKNGSGTLLQGRWIQFHRV